MFMGRDHRTSRPTAKRVNATDDRRAVNSPRCTLRVLSNSAYLPVSNGRPILTSRLLLVLALLLFGGAAVRRAQPVSAGDEWQPITPEELKMTGEPKAPGAPAVILYRQVDRDDSSVRTPHEYNYVREKIFTEEGRKYANVEIPLVKGQWDIHSIRARTIRPDGSIVNFDGKVYEKEIVKARGIKYLAKTFTLSDVQPGSIIEYHYSEDGIEKEPEKFWKKQEKKMCDVAENYVNKRKAMEQAVAEIISPSDSPDVKLQKIYARVQKIRNTSYEIEKTEQEQKRAKEKEINNVEDVWKRGYGDGYQITWLFLGLARAGGFDASPVRIATRDDHFFKPNIMRTRDLNTNVVLVKLNGKDMYFDPGSAFAPFGLLPWAEPGTAGLKLDKDGGTWVTTALPESSASQIVRKADLNLTSDGSLEGKLTVTFTGLEALWRRVAERNEDEAHSKKLLEDYVKEIVPAGIEVELTNKPEWTSSTLTLVAEYSLKVPGWVSGAGKRALLPVGLFRGPEKHMLGHSTRFHPIYFRFLYAKNATDRDRLH